MKKKFLRMMTTGLVGCMLAVTATGCGNSGTSSTPATSDTSASNTTNESASSDSSTAKDESSSQDIVSLKWIQIGNGQPDNYDAWQAHINEYLADKIGVNIDVEIISWGDWEKRRSTIINTGEDYDIIFSNDVVYESDVRLGAYYDITDLLDENCPDVKSLIPEDYWDAVSVGGKIYGIPTYKDSSITQYFVWDKDLCDKLGLDVTNLTELDQLTDAFDTIYKETNQPVTYRALDAPCQFVTTVYDNLALGLPTLGVAYDDPSKKVVATYEQEDVMHDLKIYREWFEKGYINQDAATLGELPTYQVCNIAQGWSQAAQTTWGPNMGVNATAVQWRDTIVSRGSVQGSINCISANSKHPEEALRFLNLVNSDTYVRDALYYGLEGDNFNYTDDKKVERTDKQWSMAGYSQGTFFNVSLLADQETNQWDEVKELNEKAEASPVISISIDTTEFEDELANCTEIYNRYKSEINTGAVDPEKAVPEMMSEMRSAGFDTIVEKVQAQIDAAN